MASEQRIGIRFEADASGVQAAAGAASDALAGVGAAAEKSAGQQTRSHREISAGVQSISTQLDALQKTYARLAGALAVVSGVRGLQQMADEVQNLQSRVKLAVGDAGDMQDAWRKVGEVAQSTSSSLSATSDLFARVTKAGRDAGKAGQQAIDEALQITTAVNQAAQLSGASAQASEAAIKQLVQALQSGVLRGDEFNSVMEQAPRLAQALADGLGVTTGQLREMAQDGKLSAEVVTAAIQSQADVLEQEFGSLPQTVGRSLQNLSTQFQLLVGNFNETWDATGKAAAVVDLFADNINKVAHAAKTLTAFKIAGWLKEWATAKLATAENTAATEKNTAALGANATAHTAAGAAASGHAAQLGA
ncbi:MAG: tape measure protein, partial [Ottowia sp.]|nr:tape measure protein [Ottowia sp.]